MFAIVLTLSARRSHTSGYWAKNPNFKQTEAAGIERDRAAVVAALAYEWSNGPTEGHINRLKTLKRSMYGRAKFDLLRIRTLANAKMCVGLRQ
jgi:transposase